MPYLHVKGARDTSPINSPSREKKKKIPIISHRLAELEYKVGGWLPRITVG